MNWYIWIGALSVLVIAGVETKLMLRSPDRRLRHALLALGFAGLLWPAFWWMAVRHAIKAGSRSA